MAFVRKMSNIGLVLLVTLVILGFGGVACSDEDRLALISSNADEPGEGTIQEGAVGRITTLDGQPVEGAFVQARSLGKSGAPVPDIAILSDSRGRYAWPLLPGSFELSVSADGHQPAKGRVTVKPGAVVTLDFSLKRVP